MSAHDPSILPPNLPVPADDGACLHLRGHALPGVALRRDDGRDSTLADIAMKHCATLPNSKFIIPERSPTAKGTGRTAKQDGIKQFPGQKWSGPVPADEVKV